MFVHFYVGWLLASRGSLLSLKAWTADIRDFLALPLPKAFWVKARASRDPKFVEFVDSRLVQRA